jgi:D-sedoheptulose 7-phosphate isomerase
MPRLKKLSGAADMKLAKTQSEIAAVLEEFFRTKGGVVEAVVSATVKSLRSGGKILLFGNGGSAAEAQHFAAELVNRFLKERPALPAISLTTDTSTITSIGNDMSFDRIFSRQIEALGRKGDVAIALSTSGNSPNIIEGLKAAKKIGIVTIAMTGEGGGKLAVTPGAAPDYLIDVPSKSTPRIQEVHLIILHIMAEEIEKYPGK